jgi:hypothetical protein
MNSSHLSEENSDNEDFEDFLKLSENYKNFNKELKKVVSFIGYILLTKSLPCKVPALTGISYYFRVFKYLKFISLKWEGP